MSRRALNLALATGMSPTELLDAAQAAQHERQAVDRGSHDEVHVLLVNERITIFERELARRTRIYDSGEGPNPRALWITSLVDIARQLRDVADVRYPLGMQGWQPARRLANGEEHGPCPLCGGHDRFVTWPPTPGKRSRAWCRRCDWSGDAIELLRMTTGYTFVRAVEELAGWYGIAVPAPSHDDALVVLGNCRRVLEQAS